MVGTGQEAHRQAAGHGVNADLPTNLSTLDPEQLEQAKRDRDERRSVLFRGWPLVNDTEMRSSGTTLRR